MTRLFKIHAWRLPMAIVILLALLPLPILAQDTFVIGTLEYRIISQDNMEAELVANKDVFTQNVVIPPTITYDGAEYTVSSIGKHAFYDSELRYVTIPNTVRNIGSGAFGCCYMLLSVVIPESVQTMGDGVFNCCYALRKVQILAPLTSIPPSTFSWCIFDTITIPNTVTSIGDGAFLWTPLSSVTLPASVEHIGDRAFYRSGGVITCLRPEAPQDVHPYAFSDVDYRTVKVPKGSKASYECTSPWKSFKAIIEMDEETEGITDITADSSALILPDIYTMQGALIKRAASQADIEALPSGLYIIGGKKVYVK